MECRCVAEVSIIFSTFIRNSSGDEQANTRKCPKAKYMKRYKLNGQRFQVIKFLIDGSFDYDYE